VWAVCLRRVGARAAGNRAAILRQEALALAGLFAFSLLWQVVVLWNGPAEQVVVTPYLQALPAYLDHFALGMGLAVLVAWLEERRTRPAAVRLLDRAPALSWLVALVAFWVVSTQIGIGDRLFEPYTRWQQIGRHELYALIALAVMLPAIIGSPERGLVRRVLANRALIWLGTISYGIYLWHVTVIRLLERWDYKSVAPIHPYLAWIGAALVGAVAVAAISWYLVERPLIGWGNRRRPASVAARSAGQPAPAAIES
jgi:peptidoglycan/LPS O-acetylase OafA/YrhL